MKTITCPHCQGMAAPHAHPPDDVVAVLQCQQCGELVVIFGEKVVALNRGILERGTSEQKKEHLAHVIAEFIDPSMFLPWLSEGHPSPIPRMQTARTVEDGGEQSHAKRGQGAPREISLAEVEFFRAVELNRLDEPGYFRKHLG